MKRVRLELKSIKQTLSDLANSMLPLEKMSLKEKKELRAIDREMTRGECVSLEEVKSKFWAKKRDKIPRDAIQ